ncbi:MAG: lamin tail domain-containing protein [Myxococcota bacterium]|nr:lamin tail domain-containing protein [Myxococcota bacterium]
MRANIGRLLMTGFAVALLGCGDGGTSTGNQTGDGSSSFGNGGQDGTSGVTDGQGRVMFGSDVTTTPDATTRTTDVPGPVPDATPRAETIQTTPVCGDLTCDAGEDCVTCAADCTACDLAPGFIVITEIMQNPHAVSDDVGEWIEVTNVSAGPVNLDGLTLSDGNQDTHLIKSGGPIHLMPGARAVLAPSADMGVGVAPDYVYSGFLLGNKSDSVILLAGETVIDAVSYDDGLTFPDPTGASMRLDDDATDAALNDDGGNWCEGVEAYAAGDLGTPGFENGHCVFVCGDATCSASESCEGCPQDCGACPTCGDGQCNGDETCESCEADCGGCVACGDGTCDAGESCATCESDCGACVTSGLQPGDVIITEIMYNPHLADDTVGEWIELFNPTIAALDLSGAVLSDNSSDTHQIVGPLTIASGAYLVLAASADLGLGGFLSADYVFDGVAFGNGGDSVVIWYDGVVIDEVAYDDGDTFPDEKGVAMSLDPGATNANANDQGANWCGATDVFATGADADELGTPGGPNPPCPTSTCGDGACDSDETCLLCEADCGACATCGDGACDDGESCQNCEADCGPCAVCEPEDEICNGADDDCDSAIDEDTDAECDDGISCTADECLGADGCTNPVVEEFCAIEGLCHVKDTANPDNQCETCQPFTSTTGWTAINGGVCDDGDACTDNDMCVAGGCEGQPVVVADTYEPNNHNSEAHNLGECPDDSTFPEGSVTAAMGYDETQDWYKYHTVDTFGADVQPKIVLTQPAGANYRVCMHFQCDDGDGMAEIDCEAGAMSTNSVGYTACCDDGSDGHTEVKISPDCGGFFEIDEDGMTYVEITKNGSPDVCESYAFEWGDD